MPPFNQDTFDEFVLENGIIGFFKDPLKLKSGRMSHWYINWRTLAEDAYLMDTLTDFVIAFAASKNLAPDTFYGVPDGATKLGVLTQYKWAKAAKNFAKGSHVLAMGRKTPKDHGDPKDKFFVGMPKGKTIVIEDVTSTGGSLIETVANLRTAGVDVTAALALSNRNEKTDAGQDVATALKEKNVPYFAMSNALTLLPKLCAIKKPEPMIIDAIRESFKTYGTAPISL